MICDVSSQQFEREALLVPEQIGNSEWRVGMCSQEGWGTTSWFVTCRWSLWRQMISPTSWWSPWDIEMDGAEMESGWMVTTLHSARDSNVTGGDKHHLRSPPFNPNDEGGCHSLSCSLQPSHCPFQDHSQSPRGGNCEGGRNLSALPNMWAEDAIVSGSGCQLNAFNENCSLDGKDRRSVRKKEVVESRPEQKKARAFASIHVCSCLNPSRMPPKQHWLRANMSKSSVTALFAVDYINNDVWQRKLVKIHHRFERIQGLRGPPIAL